MLLQQTAWRCACPKPSAHASSPFFGRRPLNWRGPSSPASGRLTGRSLAVETLAADDRRQQRVAKQIEREVGNLMVFDEVVQTALDGDIKRVIKPTLVSVTKVELTRDLGVAKISVAITGRESGQEQAMNTLLGLRGYVRKHVAKTVPMRRVPEIRFMLDRSMEQLERAKAVLDLARQREAGIVEPPPIMIKGVDQYSPRSKPPPRPSSSPEASPSASSLPSTGDGERDASPGSFDAVAEQARLAAFLATLDDAEDDVNERMDQAMIEQMSRAAASRTARDDGNPANSSSSSYVETDSDGESLSRHDSRAGVRVVQPEGADAVSEDGQGAAVHRRMPSRYPRRRPLTRR